MFTNKSLLVLLLVLGFSLPMNAQESIHTIVSITPVDGSRISKFAVGDEICFTTNFDDECNGFKVSLIDTYRVDNNMDNSLVYETFVGKDGNGGWKIKFYEDLVLLKDHIYQLYLEGHEAMDVKSPIVATVSAKYIGEQAAFAYSDAKIVTFSPDEGSLYDNAQNNYFFITFSKEVNIDMEKSGVIGSDGIKKPFEFWGNPYPAQGKAVWQLNIPKSTLNAATGNIDLCIYADDLDGYHVKGNAGIDENSYQKISYQCFLGYPQLTVYPLAGNIDKLDTFSFSCESGITVKNSTAEIILYNSDKSQVIHRFCASDFVANEEDDCVLSAQLPTVITEHGDYVLVIPTGAFALGTGEFDNSKLELVYSIVDRMEQYGVEITPTDKSVVKKLSQFVITLKKWDAAVPYYNNQEKITLTDASGNVVTEAKASIDENRTLLNQCIIKLNKEVTAPGDYKLNIPYRAFIVDHTGNYYSPEMYFTYTIEEESPEQMHTTVTVIKGEDESLEKLIVRFEDYTFTDIVAENQQATITNEGGQVLSVGTIVRGTDYKEIDVRVDGNKLNTSGTYYLHFPANSLIIGAGKYKYEIVIPFALSGTTGINTIDDINSIVSVYTIDGVLVGKGTRKEIYSKLKGLFVINGQKVIIK